VSIGASRRHPVERPSGNDSPGRRVRRSIHQVTKGPRRKGAPQPAADDSISPKSARNRTVAIALLACIVLTAANAGRQPPLAFEGEGRVVGVDLKAETITLAHSGVPDMMPAGVTEFPLDPSARVEGIRVGDVVRFVLDANVGSHGLLRVAQLELEGPSGDQWSRLKRSLPDSLLLLGMLSAVLLVLIGARAYAWRNRRVLWRTLQTIVSGQDELRQSIRLLVNALEGIAGVLQHGYLSEARRRSEVVQALLTTADASPYLFIVQREQLDIFRSLKERLHAPDIAEVIWDRRTRHRRARTEPVTTDRRRRERRLPPAPTWRAFGFVMVRRRPVRGDILADS
jgi:Cu/Ag efflux protein CusF